MKKQKLIPVCFGFFIISWAMVSLADSSISRVSVSSSGVQANNDDNNESPSISISEDGRFVAFGSHASNLITGDSNGKIDVFIHDRQTGKTERVSVSSDGTQGNQGSHSPSMSADGRFVAFESTATNLVTGDYNGYVQVFVHDRQTGYTEQVSVSSNEVSADGPSISPSVSSDGRFIAFRSTATNLVANPDRITASNIGAKIYVRDRQTGITDLVSVSSNEVGGNDWSEEPSISGDGRFVTFRSASSNLVNNDTNGGRGIQKYDIFVRDRLMGITERISISSTGVQANETSWSPVISGDGRFIAFGSDASNLVADDTNGARDVFIHDRQTEKTERVSISSDGIEGNYDSNFPSISADGRLIAFGSGASNLVAGDTNWARDVFIHDRQTRKTDRLSVSSDSTQGDHGSSLASVSADGRFVVFSSHASNLVSGDTNGKEDVFVTGISFSPSIIMLPTHSECRNNACVPILGAGNNACQTDANCEVPVLIINTNRCEEDDGGKKPHQKGGTVQYKNNRQQKKFVDQCCRNNYLKEYSCDANTGLKKEQWFLCKGCNDGACPLREEASPINESQVPWSCRLNIFRNLF